MLEAPQNGEFISSFQVLPSLAPEASLSSPGGATFPKDIRWIPSQLIPHILGISVLARTANSKSLGLRPSGRDELGGREWAAIECRMALYSPAGSLRVRGSGDSRGYLALSGPVAGAAVGPVWLPKYLFQRSWSEGEHSIS